MNSAVEACILKRYQKRQKQKTRKSTPRESATADFHTAAKSAVPNNSSVTVPLLIILQPDSWEKYSQGAQKRQKADRPGGILRCINILAQCH